MKLNLKIRTYPNKICWALLILLVNSVTYAQKDYTLSLKSGEIHLNERAGINKKSTVNEARVSEGNYYLIAQFYEIPNAQQREAINNSGIKFGDYLPHMAYVLSVPNGTDLSVLFDNGARALQDILPEMRKSPLLTPEKIPAHAKSGSDQVALYVSFYNKSFADIVYGKLSSLGCEVIGFNNYDMFTVLCTMGQMEQMAALPEVAYIEPAEADPVTENDEGINQHRNNVLQNSFPGGRNYDGSGVGVSVGDGGVVDRDHVDFHGRLNRSTANGASHATHVAGTVTGAGNINPRARGQAPGADLWGYDGYGDISNMGTIYNEGVGVRVTNHSLGQGEINSYNSSSRTSDLNNENYPAVVHVHSAGNSGRENFGVIGAGAGWGNITGGYKAAKNCITTGNLTDQDGLSASSSRGPLEDGRIKPDVCAKGTGVFSTNPDNAYGNSSGTSMASPGACGTVANLIQAYRENNNNQDPPTGLTKCILLNTADDLDDIGPDFRTGWGRINGYRAVKVIENNHFTSGSISNGQSQTVDFELPANVAQLKLMVYWKDPAASSSASIALINDLDINVTGGGSTHYPWVLSTNVNSASAVDAPATRGASTFDRRNNVEQVTIDNPSQGTYTVNIDGFNVPDGPQEYFVVWNFVMNEIEVTYPYGGESIIAGDEVFVQFDAHGSSGNFSVEYSTDGGQNWNTASTNVNGSRRFYSWNVPNTVTGQAKVRVSRNGLVGESVENNTIVGVPSNLQIGNRCSDRFELSWNAVSGASGYEVFILGEKYMESVGVTDQTSMVIPGNSNEEDWVSVRALTTNNGRGVRAVAIRKPTGTNSSNCGPLNLSAVAGFSYEIDCRTVNFTNSSSNDPTSYAWDFGDGNSSTQENPQHTYADVGTYTVTLTASNQFGEDDEVLEIEVRIWGAPDAEGGEACVGEPIQLTALGNNNLIWYSDADGENEVGTGNAFETPGLNETTSYYVANGGECSTGELTEVVATVNSAEAPSADGDELCEGESTTLTANGSTGYTWYDDINGDVLSETASYTTPELFETTTYYVQGAAEKITENVGINATGPGGYYEQDVRGLIVDVSEPVIWKSTFINANGAGERTIVVREGPEGPILTQTTVQLNNGGNTVQLDLDIPAGTGLYFGVTGTANLYRNNDDVNFPYESPSGSVVIRESNSTSPLDFYYFFYNNEFEVTGCASEFVEVNAVVHAYPQIGDIQENGANLSIDAGFDAYQWYKDDEMINGANQNTYTATENGDYYVVVTGPGGCQTTSGTIPVIINSTNSIEDMGLEIYPNPAADELIIVTNNKKIRSYRILSMLGKEVLSGVLNNQNNSLSISHLSAGVYFVELYVDNQKVLHRLTIE